MKNLFNSFLALAMFGFLFTSCDSDDDNNMVNDTSENEISGLITSDMRLTNDRIWELNGRTTVESGVTLTIDPGTIIKGFPGQGANSSVLIIARGATIIADGTAQEPIIFTSTADNISLGETMGTNLNQNDRGLWGGLIILGNAPSSLRGDVDAAQIEGIPASDTNGLYGGNDPEDSSGVLDYVSVRHGGTNIGEGNEINGITFGGVGRGTIVSNIEVVANVDDGVEFFGGTVNASNIFVWAVGDDSIDIDQAYSGTITNAGIVLGDISDHALEIDGPEGSLMGAFTINDLTLFGNQNTPNGEYADYRSRAMGATNNVFATGFKSSSDVELDNNGVSQNYLDGDLTFSNWVFNLPNDVTAANELFKERVGCAENCDDDNEDNDIPEEFITTFTADAASWASEGMQGGADLSAFSWTYSNNKANLGF